MDSPFVVTTESLALKGGEEVRLKYFSFQISY